MALEAPKWLNIEFIQRILRLAELDSTINVFNILTKAATDKSDNYQSDLIRVVVEFTREQDEKRIDDKKSLIFKIQPTGEGMKQMMIENSPVFDTEITMMTSALKKMNDIVGFHLGPNIFYTRWEQPLCLIMEDLASKGFRMADRQVGFDLAHSMMVIQGLAKFHASSVALCEKEPRYKYMFNKGALREDQPEMMEYFWASICTNVASEIEQWPELGKRYADKVRNFAPKLFRKCINVMKRNEDEFNVINHGDCWVNNMLFRYDENSKPIEHIFVDFQQSIYCSPAIDLNYFFSTSLNEDVCLNNITDLHKEYLQTLTTTMQQLGCKTVPPTKEELDRSLKERALFGLIASMSVLPMSMIDKDEALDVEEMISEKGILSHPGIKNPRFRRIMSRRMPEYVEMGLLDV